MRKYDRSAVSAKFLLGGIGTGNISVNQNDRLVDIEIFNTPNKGFNPPYTFFAIHCESEDGKFTSALESRLQPPFAASHGFATPELGGLPRLDKSEMWAEYPFLNLSFQSDGAPITASLEVLCHLYRLTQMIRPYLQPC